RRDVERPRCVRLLDRDVDRPQPRPVHPHVRHQVPPGVRHGDVHRLADLGGLLLSSGNDPAGVGESNHGRSFVLGCVLASNIGACLTGARRPVPPSASAPEPSPRRAPPPASPLPVPPAQAKPSRPAPAVRRPPSPALPPAPAAPAAAAPPAPERSA